jgi:hypothetical protein
MHKVSRKALTPDQLDNLGLALIEMAKEMWVMKDRQMITEALLKEKGLLADLDAYQPGPELATLIANERKRFLGAFSAALFHQDDA